MGTCFTNGTFKMRKGTGIPNPFCQVAQSEPPRSAATAGLQQSVLVFRVGTCFSNKPENLSIGKENSGSIISEHLFVKGLESLEE